jgi:putative transposase
MKLTGKVKLQPTPEQANLLKQTLEIANAACNYISEKAWEHKRFSRVPLHKLVYYDTREKFDLSAQVVVRCISKVVDSYKLNRKVKRTFNPIGAIALDDRILKWYVDLQEVSIWTIEGRQRISYLCGEHQRKLLQSQHGESDLVFINGEFYLLAACDVETPEPQDVHDVLGCDLGIVNLTTDSDGEHYSGKAIEDNRSKHEHRRKNLQKKQTKSAKRKLKKISGKQARFQSNTNHAISKRLVQKAQDTERAIALEDLIGIRNRSRFRRKQRSKFANWSFYQLRQYITYKAMLVGIPVIFVDPKYTSQTCPVCGCVSKSNRPNQSTFSCVSCGYSANADTTAAINIARAAVNQPNEYLTQGSALRGSYKLPALAGSS